MLQNALQTLVMKITLLPEALSYKSLVLSTVCLSLSLAAVSVGRAGSLYYFTDEGHQKALLITLLMRKGKILGCLSLHLLLDSNLRRNYLILWLSLSICKGPTDRVLGIL